MKNRVGFLVVALALALASSILVRAAEAPAGPSTAAAPLQVTYYYLPG